MGDTTQHAEAPADAQIQMMLDSVVMLKGKLVNTKVILSGYKIKSDKLSQLKKVQKDLKEQIDDEKERIESVFYDDKTYEEAKNEQLTLKNQIKEKTGELREVVKAKYKVRELQTEDRIVAGEQMKLQIDFGATMFINGVELK